MTRRSSHIVCAAVWIGLYPITCRQLVPSHWYQQQNVIKQTTTRTHTHTIL